MKLLTLKFFVLLVVLFIPNTVNSKELNGLKNLVIYEDQKKISKISFKNEKDKNVSLSEYENKLLILNFYTGEMIWIFLLLEINLSFLVYFQLYSLR